MTAVLLIIVILQTIIFTVRELHQDKIIEELKRENLSMKMDVMISKEVHRYAVLHMDEGYK
jgi:hypothetical protein